MSEPKIWRQWADRALAAEKRVEELEKELAEARKALEKIAKPALGGKQQQWIAQAALADRKEEKNG